MKEQKTPAEGSFYSFQAVTEDGARLKRKGGRPLRRSARALPLTHELLKKFDQNLRLINFYFLIKMKISARSGRKFSITFHFSLFTFH